MSQDITTTWLSSSPSRRNNTPFRKGGFLLLQDEPSPPLTSHGHGTLSQLIKNRSHSSLANYGSTWRGITPSGPDDEESALSHSDLLSHTHPEPPEDEPHRRLQLDERRLNLILNGPPMRSMRLIGNSNPRYRWERYWKTEDQLKAYRKPVRKYYERINYLIQQYLYIDRLLDSSLPHDLLNEYNNMPPTSFRKGIEVPETISEEQPDSGISYGRTTTASGSWRSANDADSVSSGGGRLENGNAAAVQDSDGPRKESSGSRKIKRTPKNIYRPTETTPLFQRDGDNEEEEGENGSVGSSEPKPEIPWLEDDDDLDSNDRIVTVAIYVNFAANAILLAGKVAVVVSVSSMSVLASLVDAVLDFLSTVIVWTTTWLISRQDQYQYPVGRRRLEPLGVLVFSVIMITCFAQVALESVQRLAGPNHEVIELGIPAVGIMIGTVVVKGLCWLWCRLIKNSSVQALADDAMTDVIFNIGSILFPIIGFYAKIWWLDALGGLLLSLVVMFNWSQTSGQHIKNLSGFSATADQRNILLYLTMRFANTIKQIQGLQAYHAGDKLNVEVDIILDASTPLRDSHDVSESLSYVLESVPIVDRAFVHADYASYNLPTHMDQQQSG
ncbi:hypothetical protein F4778DRAFT_222014 [Xylariomycetidae sp. FL2044]|nr:hypothetical protein F4778DRAFT_222014 [Xylariomycetidae sp. FL2044]